MYSPPVLKVFSRRWSQLSLRPPPGRTTTKSSKQQPDRFYILTTVHLQRIQPRTDMTAWRGPRRWRPYWWKRRPEPWPLSPCGTAPGTGAAVPRQPPCLTSPCGCPTSLETPRPRPCCWSLTVKAWRCARMWKLGWPIKVRLCVERGDSRRGSSVQSELCNKLSSGNSSDV